MIKRDLCHTIKKKLFPGGMNVANVGGMVVTNSNMSGAGMLGGGIINNVNKQMPTHMGNNHHPNAQHHPHAQVNIRLNIFIFTRYFLNSSCYFLIRNIAPLVQFLTKK